jgi:hypothetical protein
MLGLGFVCLAGEAAAQLEPGRITLTPQVGLSLSLSELLRTTAVYPTGRPTDPDNPVVTDIKLDPGLVVGGRVGYNLTRKLMAEAEFNWNMSVCVIRQLEIKPDAEEGDEEQYETTTFDSDVLMYGLGLSYFPGKWNNIVPIVNFGVGEHILNLRRKGEVDPDPVRDRYISAGLGFGVQATKKLLIRADIRNVMYNFRFDNQFVDPVESRKILFRREEFIGTTEPAGDKFQNDLIMTLAFAIQTF